MGEQLLVTIGAKDSASTVIKKVNSELKYLDREYGLAKKSSKDFESSQDGLRTKLDYLGNKYEVNKTKLQAYKNQLDKAKESVAKKEEELEKLKNAEGDNAVAIEKAEKQLEKYKDQLDKANKNINLTEKEMGNLTKEIDSTSESLDNFKVEQFKARMEEVSQSVQDAGQKIKNVGQGMSNIGGGLMKLSAPILAGSVAIGKMNMDFEQGIANINTLLDDTTNLDSYKNKIKELSDDTGINVEIMTDGMYQAISSLGDAGKQTEGIFEVMAKSSKAGGAETSDSVSLISAAMKGYGDISEKTAQKVSDLAFVTAKLGVTTFPEMAKSMQPLFPLSSALNISMEDLFGSMATLTGVTGNTSEVSTQLKAIFSNLIKPTKAMAEVIKKYGYENSQAMIKSEGMAGVLEILQKETGGSADKMGVLFSSTEALTAVTALCGANYKDFINKSGQMNNVLGATDTAMKKVSSTEKDKLTTSINRLKNSFLESGEKLTPLIDGLSNGIEDVANAIGKMNPEVVASIAKIGLFTFATGGALKGVGGLTQGIGSLVIGSGKAIGKFTEFASKTKTLEKISSMASAQGISKFGAAITVLGPAALGASVGVAAVASGILVAKTNADLMNKTILYTTDEMNGLERTLTKFNGTQVKSKDELIESGLVYEDFNKNISPEFQKKVEESTMKINEFNMKLHEINFDGAITEEESKIFEEDVKKTCDSAIAAIKSKQEETNKAMNDLFVNDGVINESEKRVIDFMNKTSDTQITEINKLKSDILGIEQKALEDKRALTEGEIQIIQEKNNRIRQIELEAIGSNQDEILYAQKEFNERIKGISLEDATVLVQEKAKIRDDERAKIVAGYDTLIAQMKEKLSEATGEDKIALEEQIANAENTRNEKLRVNDELYNSYLELINERSPEVLENLNKFNGQMLEQEDLASQEKLKKIQERYDGLAKITETGNALVLNKTTGYLEAVAVVVDENTGEITGIWESVTGQVGGYTKDIEGKVKEMGMQHEFTATDVISAFDDMENTTIDSAGNIVNANGDIVWALKDVKDTGNNTREGILDLNGTPIKIKANTDGAITNLNEVQNAVEDIDPFKQVTISTLFEAVGSGIKSLFGFADGTSYAPSGIAFVAEEGQELIEKNGTFYLTGDNGPQLFNFSGGEKVYTAAQTRDILTSGSYYNYDSVASRELINSNTNNNYYSDNSINSKLNKTMESILTVLSNIQPGLTVNLNSIKQTPYEAYKEAERFERNRALKFR